jgi:hypothetical protein
LFVAFVVALVLAAGCHLLLPFESRPSDSYQCDAKITIAKVAPLKCEDYIKVTSTHSQKIEFAVFSNSDPGQYPKLYLDPRGYVPTADGIPDAVKGTCLVRLPYEDRTSKAQPYLELSFAVPIETIYIAFDRRAKTLPPWLSVFTPVSGAILKSTEKPSPEPGSPNVQYQLYEPTNPTAFTNRASFAGNDLGTVWTGNAIGAQYLVFVRRTQPTTVNPETRPVTVEACGLQPNATSQAMYNAARQREGDILDEWVADNKEYEQAHKSGLVELAFQVSDCKPVQSLSTPHYPKACGKTDDVNSTQQNLVVNAWPRLSTASIDAAVSTVTVEVRGTTQSVAAGGPISFRIDENSNLIIDEATLFSGPLVVERIHIEKVSLGQRGPAIASCVDKPVPKPYGLCNNYVIAATRTAFAGLAATVDGRHVFTQLTNNQAIAVTVDHNNYVFKLSGGGIDGRIDTNDGPVLVRLSLDVTGRFENFAPVASAKESPTRFECKDANKGIVTLDASASYDRDQNPATLLYKWIEDAGTPAERVLGTQKRLTDLPMNFGGHRITLSVEDNRGAIASVVFDAEVYDSKIDGYTPPGDVYALFKGRATPVVLGTATASDACSGQVLIRNNAPNKKAFSEGFTPVEWTFDDYRGNLALHRQNVFVLPPRMYPPPIAAGQAWLNAVPGQGQTLTYLYGTKAQGAVMSVDEYILLETPSGDVYTFDEQNQLGKPNEITRHRPTTAFGAADTAAFLTVSQWDKRFPQKGTYAFRHILVRPGGDPRDNATVIAHHRFDLTQGMEP